jgi:hypothetical protein
MEFLAYRILYLVHTRNRSGTFVSLCMDLSINTDRIFA